MSGPVTKSSGSPDSQLPSGLPESDTSFPSPQAAAHQFRIPHIEKHVTPTLATDMRSTLATQGFSRLS